METNELALPWKVEPVMTACPPWRRCRKPAELLFEVSSASTAVEVCGESRKLEFHQVTLDANEMAEDSTYESMLCVKPEVHVYRIPPRASNRGYRAADWKLDEPAWSGRMKITAKGKLAYIKLEDKNTGELFAQAPVEQYPGSVVEAVTDSSRYFVIRIEDGNGRHAFIGLGFADRGDSFDFNVALQDHFKWVKQEGELAKMEATQSTAPKLDLSFKEGQTIKISIGNIKKKDASGAKPRPMAGGLLPPPPGVKVGGVIPPPGSQHTITPEQQQTNIGPFLDFGSPVSETQPSSDMWGDFTSAGSNSSKDAVKSGWVQFS